MTFKIGTKVIFRGNDNETLQPLIKSGTVTKVGRDTVWLDNAHKVEDQVFAAFLYPDTLECRAFLEEGITLTQKHKQEEAEYMAKTYQLNNELVRKGEK